MIVFFILSYFIFVKKPVDQKAQREAELEKLMRQSTAESPADQSVNRSEIEKLLKQSTPAPTAGTSTSGQPKPATPSLTSDQKNALLKLMSAPR